MKEFFGVSIVEILQTGFAGVSILLMYMAYRLMAATMDTEQDIERLKVKRTSIFGFMAFSALVMAGSLFIFVSQMGKQAIAVDVSIRPENTEAIGMMRLEFAGRHIEVTEDGRAEGISISADEIVTVDFDDLTDHMDDLRADASASLTKAQQLADARDTLKEENAVLLTRLDSFIQQEASEAFASLNISVTEELLEREAGE